MRLLIITQKINRDDDVLGFFHGWIAGFAKQAEKITAVCLEMGPHDLPSNVTVFSLGKENGRSRLKYIFNLYRIILRERDSYDAVFVHMNPEYVIAAGWLWKLLGKKVGLWYAHGHPSWQLKAAVPFSDVVFTSVKEACRISTPKLRVIGQGIDTALFRPLGVKKRSSPFRIISIGRISPAKDYETLIAAAEMLRAKNLSFDIQILGAAGLAEQEAYFSALKNLIQEKSLDSVFHFAGSVPNKDIVSHLQKSDLFASMTHTGSLDKAGVEAMATGLPLVTCGEAFADVLGEYASVSMYPKKDAAELAARIEYFMKLDQAAYLSISDGLREIVVRDHSLEAYVGKVLRILAE